jgi:hypothetical protein
LQLDKTDDFFRHALLLTGFNALACGLGSPGLTTHQNNIRAESESAN